MTTKHKHDNPILVTGAAGAVGGIGRNLTEFLLARGHKVRALVRREDERAEALRRLGAEVVEGDLTDLASMHRAIEGCGRIYFGMSVSPAYLEATINTAAVAPPHSAPGQQQTLSRRCGLGRRVSTVRIAHSSPQVPFGSGLSTAIRSYKPQH